MSPEKKSNKKDTNTNTKRQIQDNFKANTRIKMPPEKKSNKSFVHSQKTLISLKGLKGYLKIPENPYSCVVSATMEFANAMHH